MSLYADVLTILLVIRFNLFFQFKLCSTTKQILQHIITNSSKLFSNHINFLFKWFRFNWPSSNWLKFSDNLLSICTILSAIKSIFYSKFHLFIINIVYEISSLSLEFQCFTISQKLLCFVLCLFYSSDLEFTCLLTFWASTLLF